MALVTFSWSTAAPEGRLLAGSPMCSSIHRDGTVAFHKRWRSLRKWMERIGSVARGDAGHEEAWCREWGALADRIRGTGLAALAVGHRISARDALLRASNYYRMAEFYRRSDPDNDAESARLARLSRESFAAAAELLDVPARRV